MEAETLRSKAQIKSHGSLLRELRNPNTDNKVNVDDFQELKHYLTSASSDIKVSRPKIPLESFVGLREIKKDIFNYLDKATRAQLRVQNYFDEENDRILLFGKNGTGKTHLVRAIASELKASLIEFGAGSQWLSNLDSYTKALYQICAEYGPSTVLLLDNLDELCSGDEEKARAMIRFIRDIQSTWAKNDLPESPSRLVIFATTSRPNLLDEKLVLGFDRRIYIPTLNFQERKQLFQRMIQKNWKLGHVLTPKDMDWVARKTYGILTNQIETLVDKAAHLQYPDWPSDESLAEDFPKGAMEGVNWRALEVNDFLEVLRGFLVLDSKGFFEFETFQRKFGNGPFMRIYEREDCSEEGYGKKGKKKNGWMWTAFSWL